MTAAPQTSLPLHACRWRRCPRESAAATQGALALRRGPQNGRHSLHAWHNRDRVRGQSRPSPISELFDSGATLHVVSPRPPGVPGSITLIVEFACEDVRDARLSGRSASARASMSAVPRTYRPNRASRFTGGRLPAAGGGGGNGISFRLVAHPPLVTGLLSL